MDYYDDLIYKTPLKVWYRGQFGDLMYRYEQEDNKREGRAQRQVLPFFVPKIKESTLIYAASAAASSAAVTEENPAALQQK